MIFIRNILNKGLKLSNYHNFVTKFKFLNLNFFRYRDRLSAIDMLQIKKVIEHVYEKVMGQGSDTGSQTAGGNSSQERSETDKEEDLSSIAEEKVELLCNDQVSKQQHVLPLRPSSTPVTM